MSPENTPSLSDVLLTTAAEHTWPGQIPAGSPTDIATRLKASIETLPCLQRSRVVEMMLGKLDTVTTNGQFIDVSTQILETAERIRNILVQQGVIKTAKNPYDPFVPTLTKPEKSTTLMPMEEIARQNNNSTFLMTLHYVNRVLEVLKEARNTVIGQASIETSPRAIVDALPIETHSASSDKKHSPSPETGETKPADFKWCGIDFNKRMKLVPILAQWYIEGKNIVSYEEIKKIYAEKIGVENITDANLFQLLRNIRLKFEGSHKKTPFRIVSKTGIQFIYSEEVSTPEKPTPEITESPDDMFLQESFDPRVLTDMEIKERKKLQETDIKTLDLDDISKNVLMALTSQTTAIHIDGLVKQIEGIDSVAEINACVPQILFSLWGAGYTGTIQIRNDHIFFIQE